jgi:hypothetical protein
VASLASSQGSIYSAKIVFDVWVSEKTIAPGSGRRDRSTSELIDAHAKNNFERGNIFSHEFDYKGTWHQCKFLSSEQVADRWRNRKEERVLPKTTPFREQFLSSSPPELTSLNSI